MKTIAQPLPDVKKCPDCGGPVEKDTWGLWCPNGRCKWKGINKS